ncbi:DUF3800 domain-containing protein [Amycolatopsis albispora]|uniref:NAD-dependent protein deacetylase of SIR2 family n=1 Tax=Amycolatopsis albispora TaxID=1804986 RepID=A0A344L216_9PSEU|nr:DUF3800 domain-containing protein [Amycolatopsis albispora]AXB42090.1 hypothetical protein A4R43_05745 [Amycolatopsis albispora]
MRDDERPFVEIACDESGSEGEKLIGGETDVFAHAGVALSPAAAAACLTEIRGRIRSPALEYKANHLLRSKHRPVLTWLLAPGGPLSGVAVVHLTDKALFTAGLLAELLGEDRDRLHGDGLRAFGAAGWSRVLGAFNDLIRTTNRQEPADSLAELVAGTGLADRLRRADVAAWRGGALVNPLLPALAETVRWFGDGGHGVSVVHDEQPSLTAERLTVVRRLLGNVPLRLRFVDSRADARVQVADFLAGVARKIASDELNGRGDAELSALLRPFTAPTSAWWNGLRRGSGRDLAVGG